MNHFVVMGVSGCGKSTIAALVAKRLNATMIEADALHGVDNIKKMERGEALSDEDRWPWLARVAHEIKVSPEPVIISCSALRHAYRQSLIDNACVPIGFIHLHAERDVIAERMAKREGHFMPLGLLDSQIATLEPLQKNEIGVVVDIAQTVQEVTDDAMQFISQKLHTME